MKVKIIKGPLFESREKAAHELLYLIIIKKVINQEE